MQSHFNILFLLLIQDDYVIEHQRKEKLAKYDKYFKSFEYSRALDAALDVSVDREIDKLITSLIDLFD